MTRKTPTPGWRSLGRYGEEGPWFVALPAEHAERYSASALGHPPALTELTVTDRESGAVFRWSAIDAHPVTLSMASDETAANVTRLLQDGRAIVGLARRQTGGPARGTGVTVSRLIAATVELWDPLPLPNGTPPREADVAEHVELDRDGRQLRRIAARADGPGEPFERILAAAARARGAITSG